MRTKKSKLARGWLVLIAVVSLCIVMLIAGWGTAMVHNHKLVPVETRKTESVRNKSHSKQNTPTEKSLSDLDRYALIYYGGIQAAKETPKSEEAKTFKNVVTPSGRSTDTVLNVTPMKISRDFVSNPGTGYFMAIAPVDLTFIGYAGYTRDGNTIYYYSLMGNNPNRLPFATVSFQSLYQKYYQPESQRSKVEALKSQLHTQKVNKTFANFSSSTPNDPSQASKESGEASSASDGDHEPINDDMLEDFTRRFLYPNMKRADGEATLPRGSEDRGYVAMIKVYPTGETDDDSATIAATADGTIYSAKDGELLEKDGENYFDFPD